MLSGHEPIDDKIYCAIEWPPEKLRQTGRKHIAKLV
jgi:hypothetical protein